MNTLLLLSFLLTPFSPEILLAHSEHEKKAVKASRQSAVYISPVKASGHGSGTYIEIDGSFFIVTAKHVTVGHKEFFIDGNSGKESSLAKKIYELPGKDISILQVGKFKTLKPISLSKACKLTFGETVYFSGFPSHYSLMTTKAFISGGDRHTKYMQGLAWFGSSGSGLINEKNELCGVITAIATERRGFFVHALESLNYAHVITNKDILQIKQVIKKLRAK